MVTVAEIFRQHGPAYRAAHAADLLPSHRRVMWCIENCRTEALGGHVYECPQCNATIYSYHSCQNRHCNLCQSHKAKEWLDTTKAKMQLPTNYYLVTFTLPAELRDICYQNQRAMYNLLFRSASAALQELARDPRFVGGQIGIIGVLHTWTRDLRYHPHVHFLVPAGSLDFTQERWHPVRNHMLVHVKPLMIMFRAKIRDGLKKLGLYPQVDNRVWGKPWSVNSTSVGYGERAFEYMADYLFRIGISHQRILKCDAGQVTFCYTDSTTKRRVVCELPVDEFITRFLKHVLPKGFVKIRYYGFYAPGARAKLTTVRTLLGADEVPKATAHPPAVAEPMMDDGGANALGQPCCPNCGESLRRIGTVPKRSRHPPS